ncbi:hypothetical protein DM860_014117 [Cuscuta australis]|uniref:Late embryogenesis abundant protein LEA-2 subgroup domain-containing protein n=1 Tax=Cuscuta australis TaxID=267555 RepID=A0A328DFC4_9ASTE|nr:hypothetical protein DM860_014117 [Cuscuta australis]
MEERVPPAGGDEGWKGVPPRAPSETYVVQIPRDQVYRVPPPENAKFIQTYRGKQSKNDTNLPKCCCCCCCWFLTPLLFISIAISIFLVIVNVLYPPIPPQFSITRVHYLKNSTVEISLHVENNNARSKVLFGRGGKSGLVFKNHAVATGRFPPSVLLEPRGRKDVDLKLVGDVVNLSRDLRKELNEEGKAKPMTLKVSSVSMEVSSWMKGKKKDATIITCEFKVDSLKKKIEKRAEQLKSRFCRTAGTTEQQHRPPRRRRPSAAPTSRAPGISK